MIERYTLISADCHAGYPVPLGGYRDYVDPAYRETYQASVAEEERLYEQVDSLFAEEFMGELRDHVPEEPHFGMEVPEILE